MKIQIKPSQPLYLTLIVVLLLSLLVPLDGMWTSKRYGLSEKAKALLGTPSTDYDSLMKYEDGVYRFNSEAVASAKPDAANPMAGLGRDGADKNTMPAYDLHTDPKKGVTVYDAASKLSFSLIPEFKALSGQKVDSHVVYPLLGIDGQAVYTPKANGLKEDIIIQKEQGDELKFNYTLDLPDSLEARLLDTGDIGIYSGDAALFGNISYGSDADQQKVELARKNAQKNNLVFTIPAPIIEQQNSSVPTEAKAHFELKGTQVTVLAKGLKNLQYPISIDPTVVVNSAAAFANGNNEANVEQDSGNNQIKRGSISGGSTGSFSATNSFTTGRFGLCTAAYNGYLYVMGGIDGSSIAHNDVQYAAINSNGTVGAWTATTSFTNLRYQFSCAAANGYLYITAGADASNSKYADVQYAALASNGTVGTWTATTSLPAARYAHNTVISNNYIYVLGGDTGSLSNAALYAPLKGDGTIGSWTTTSSFTTARASFAAASYGNYLYIMGGHNGTTDMNDVQYAFVNADGTLGTWTATTSFTTSRYSLAGFAHNGYLYVTGGRNVGGPTELNNVSYAAINTDGSVGVWSSTNSFSVVRHGHVAIGYNGYIYIAGGYEGGVGYYNSVQYAKVDNPGTVGSWKTTNSISVTRYASAIIAYNGYLYSLGGGQTVSNTSCKDSGTSIYCNDVQYAAINADGSVGSWSNTSYMSGARAYHQVAVYNGYMYVTGGTTAGASYTTDVQYAAINANGTLGTWTSTTAMGTARTEHTSVIYNGYIYAIGGWNGGYLATTEYAPINTNGTVGSWAATTSFTTARYNHTSAVYAGYVYVAGGYSGSRLDDVQYAPLNSNGTIGTWSATSTLTSVRQSAVMAAVNGYMYIYGGINASADTNDMQYAVINSNGTLGSWATLASTFTSVRDSLAGTFYGGMLYLSGGINGSTTFNDVQYAPVNNGGSGAIGAWTAGTSFTGVRYSAQIAAYNGYLYLIAGAESGGTPHYFNDVQYAAINANGSLGSWAATSSFTNARYNHAGFIYKGYLYVVGGLASDNTTKYNDVQYAAINANGTLGSFASTTSFTTARTELKATAYNGYMYLTGGSGGGSYLTDVQYAPINANGTVGTWTATTSVPGSQYAGNCLVANNGYIYAVGGYDGTNFITRVVYAPLNSNGTVGSWSTTSSLNAVRYGGGCAVANGYLYAISGTGGNGDKSTEYAAINSNGTLGNWGYSSLLANDRRAISSAAYYNGYLYVAGGTAGGVFTNSTEYAPLKSIARKATYSKLIDAGTATAPTSLIPKGTFRASTNQTLNHMYAGTNAVFGTMNTVNGRPFTSGSAASLAASGATQPRYYWLQFVLDDAQNATFPESTVSTVTGFELFYRPAQSGSVNNRLRGGKTLLNGSGSGLDAQPN